MAAPDLTTVGERLYESVEPFTFDETNQDYALAHFCLAIARMFDQVASYAEDRDDGTPGWGAMMDPDLVPVEAIPWLGQFVGVTVPDGLSEDQQRALVKDVGGFRRGTVDSLVAAAQQYLTGAKAVTVLERYGSPYRLRVSTRGPETPSDSIPLAWGEPINYIVNPNAQGPATPPATIAGWSPRGQNNADFQEVLDPLDGLPAFRLIRNTDAGGLQSMYMDDNPNSVAVVPGDWIAVACEIRAAGTPRVFSVTVHGNVTPTIGAPVAAVTIGNTYQRFTGAVQVPAGTDANAGIRINVTASDGEIFYVRKVMMVKGTSQADALAGVAKYFDGSTPNYQFSGAPHNSTSKSPTSWSASQIIQNALNAQKPAGLILEYVTLAGGTFDTVRNTNASFNAVVASYRDFNELKLHPDKRTTWTYDDVDNTLTGGEATYASVLTDYITYLDLLTPNT